MLLCCMRCQSRDSYAPYLYVVLICWRYFVRIFVIPASINCDNVLVNINSGYSLILFIWIKIPKVLF